MRQALLQPGRVAARLVVLLPLARSLALAAGLATAMAGSQAFAEPCADAAAIVEVAAKPGVKELRRLQREQARLRAELTASGVRPELLPAVLEPPEGLPVKGAVVVVHGRGQSPAAMRSLSEAYQQRGYVVVEVLLAGHGNADPAALEGATLAQWRQDVASAVRRTRRLKLPITFLGYSLGGGLSLEAFMNTRGAPGAAQDQLRLVAPFLRMEPAVKAESAARLAAHERWMAPPNPALGPLSPLGYRDVALSTYPQLLALEPALDGAAGRLGTRSDVAVVFSDVDGVVAAEPIRKLAAATGARTYELGPESRVKHTTIIFPRTLKPDVWERIIATLAP
jgi:pimeloyl-ACP methyl ester carboxylesterase